MDTVFINGQTAPNTQGTGRKTRPLDTGKKSTPMEMYTRETGGKIRQKDTESTKKRMEHFIKGVGRIISHMARG